MRPTVRFSSTKPEFYSTLNQRVNEYFKTRKLNRSGNTEMFIKTVFMFSLYCIPYLLMITGVKPLGKVIVFPKWGCHNQGIEILRPLK